MKEELCFRVEPAIPVIVVPEADRPAHDLARGGQPEPFRFGTQADCRTETPPGDRSPVEGIRYGYAFKV